MPDSISFFRQPTILFDLECVDSRSMVDFLKILDI